MLVLRLYPQKSFGKIVDYFGVFDDAAKALQFDEETIKRVITNFSLLKHKLPQAIKDALSYFSGVDRTLVLLKNMSESELIIILKF
jgi:type I restriction enzyme R subunit